MSWAADGQDGNGLYLENMSYGLFSLVNSLDILLLVFHQYFVYGKGTHKIIHRDSNKFKVEAAVDFDADTKDHHHHLSLDKEALKEQQRIRVLCWVMTSPENLPIKGKPGLPPTGFPSDSFPFCCWTSLKAFPIRF